MCSPRAASPSARAACARLIGEAAAAIVAALSGHTQPPPAPHEAPAPHPEWEMSRRQR
jgi:hypothetical protein